MNRSDRTSLARDLAATFLAGPWERREMARRAAASFGLPRSPRWLSTLAREVVRVFGPDPPHGRDGRIAALIAPRLRPLRRAGIARRPALVHPCLVPARMGTAAAPVLRERGLPEVATPGELAAWLGLDRDRLAWLADVRGLSRRTHDGPLVHYRYRWVPKRSGGARLLEIPKPDLAAAQRKILRELLDRVPPHASAVGFRKGRNVLDHASAHAGAAVVLRMDLGDFFASVAATRVHAIFVALGYPAAVSSLLTGLCTHRTSMFVRHASTDHAAWSRLRERHLPQGAPTSPALANLAALGLDVRLAALASKAGAAYTRYADDLAFSGGTGFARSTAAFHVLACAIVIEESFAPNPRKTRIMRASSRQQITGLVVNAKPSLPRDELDRLKATLHNCVAHGPASQNRDGRADFRAWLAGKVAWVASVHPARGARLRAMLERIRW